MMAYENANHKNLRNKDGGMSLLESLLAIATRLSLDYLLNRLRF
jgi:hypothetical protein